MRTPPWRDLRLQADSYGLVRFLGEVVPSKESIASCVRSANLPLGQLSMEGTPEAVWSAVLWEADRLGKFERLLGELIRHLDGDGRLPELRWWIKSIGVEDLRLARRHIAALYDNFIGLSDPRELEPQVEGLSGELVSLTKSLADAHRSRESFGGSSDADRLVRRARDLARHASAAVDSLLFQVREVVAYLDRPSLSPNDRDNTDRTIGGFALVDHLMRQRASADQAVSSLLDVLLAVVPGQGERPPDV